MPVTSSNKKVSFLPTDQLGTALTTEVQREADKSTDQVHKYGFKIENAVAQVNYLADIDEMNGSNFLTSPSAISEVKKLGKIQIKLKSKRERAEKQESLKSENMKVKEKLTLTKIGSLIEGASIFKNKIKSRNETLTAFEEKQRRTFSRRSFKIKSTINEITEYCTVETSNKKSKIRKVFDTESKYKKKVESIFEQYERTAIRNKIAGELGNKPRTLLLFKKV